MFDHWYLYLLLGIGTIIFPLLVGYYIRDKTKSKGLYFLGAIGLHFLGAFLRAPAGYYYGNFWLAEALAGAVALIGLYLIYRYKPEKVFQDKETLFEDDWGDHERVEEEENRDQ